VAAAAAVVKVRSRMGANLRLGLRYPVIGQFTRPL
jgi:hypothetical protein